MSAPASEDKPAGPQMATIPPPSPAGLVFAQKLAVILGETEEKPIIQLARSVDYLGEEKAQAYADEALTLYAGEGILTKDKSRKRSPGGTFFALVRMRLAHKKDWRRIKPILKPLSEQPVTLADQMPMLIESTSRMKAGMLASCKLILTGRPESRIQKQAQFVAFTIKLTQQPVLPKGLPTFGKVETKYLILVAMKQWEKVEKKITDDKDDQLYIEGFATVQPDFKSGIVVLAQNVNTIGLMRIRKK